MKYCFTILFVLISYCVIAQERWAVVVGISNYPEASGWSNIHGAEDLDIIVPMLINNGFSLDHITAITNEQAIKESIKNELLGLTDKVEFGDIVYIQLSGHGQLITDINNDEEDGYDESFVAYDALRMAERGYNGENHIIDDELNSWLYCIKNKIGEEGKLIIVIDACHSGTVTRGKGDVIRGINDKFEISAPYQEVEHLIYNVDWLCISACKSYQINEEYNGRGRLSTALGNVFCSGMSLEELMTAINNEYRKMPSRLPQSPSFEYGDSASMQNHVM